jgi:hypothetical protein
MSHMQALEEELSLENLQKDSERPRKQLLPQRPSGMDIAASFYGHKREDVNEMYRNFNGRTGINATKLSEAELNCPPVPEVNEDLVRQIEARAEANKNLVLDLAEKGMISKQSLLQYLGFDYETEVARLKLEQQVASQYFPGTAMEETTEEQPPKENKIIDDLKRLQRLVTDGSKSREKLQDASKTVGKALMSLWTSSGKTLPNHYDFIGNQKLNELIYTNLPSPLFAVQYLSGNSSLFVLDEPEFTNRGPVYKIRPEQDLFSSSATMQTVVKFAQLIADGYLKRLYDKLHDELHNDEELYQVIVSTGNSFDFLGRQQIIQLPPEIRKEWAQYAYDKLPENITIDELAEQQLNIKQRAALKMLEWLCGNTHRREGRTEVWAYYFLKMAMQSPNNDIEVRELDSKYLAQRGITFDRIVSIVETLKLGYFAFDKSKLTVRYIKEAEHNI